MTRPVDYVSAPAVYTQITLEKGPGTVRLIFPPLPKWMLSPLLFPAIVYSVITTLLLIETALFTIRYIKWGKIPNGRLTWRFRSGFWGMREHHLPADKISSVQYKLISDIFGRKTTFQLTILLHTGQKFSRRFSTKNAELPEQVARAFREAIGISAYTA